MRSGSPPRRVVVDTNLFVSAALSKLGQPHRLIEDFRHDRITVLTSGPLRDEVERVLRRLRLVSRFGLTAQYREDILFPLDSRAIRVTPSARLPVAVQDPKDEMVLATALGGGAGFLISGDDDLLELDGDPRIGPLRIVTVRDFLQLVDAD